MEDKIHYAQSIISKHDSTDESCLIGAVTATTTSSSSSSLLFSGDGGRDEAKEYLKAVTELQTGMHFFVTENSSSEKLVRAQNLKSNRETSKSAIDGLPDPGGPATKESKRESSFKTKEETDEKRGQFTLVVGGLLVIAFVVPMAQYYAYLSRK